MRNNPFRANGAHRVWLKAIQPSLFCILPALVALTLTPVSHAHIKASDDCGLIGNPCVHTKCKYEIFDLCPSAVPAGYSKNYKGCGTFYHYQLAFCPHNCTSPFVWDMNANRCVLDCPPGNPSFSSASGACVAAPNSAASPRQCAGNPIDIATGEKIQAEQPDYSESRLLPLSFQRTYFSQKALEANPLYKAHARGELIDAPSSQERGEAWVRHSWPSGYTGVLPSIQSNPQLNDLTRLDWNETTTPKAGYKQWRHNYLYALADLGNNTVLLSRPNGDKWEFMWDATQQIYVSSILSEATLTLVNNVWTFDPRAPNSPKELYDINGNLTRLELNQTVFNTFTYDANRYLDTVTHSLGGTLTFNYESDGRLTSVDFPNQNSISILYDSVYNPVTVTRLFPSDTNTVRTYHYEDTRHPFALTGITDESGARYATWAYDELGRAISSQHFGSTDLVQFDFTDGNAIKVTNPLDKEQIYHYQSIGSSKRLVRVQGVETELCEAASQYRTYYANGSIQTETDWNGNVTFYERDSLGRVTTQEMGYRWNGAPQYGEVSGDVKTQLNVPTGVSIDVIQTCWHAEFGLAEKVLRGSKVTEFTFDASGNIESYLERSLEQGELFECQ